VSSVIEADRLAIRIAAQHAHHEDSGAFTGEISIPMVKRLGCTYVIVGHSERREHFSMSDDQVAATVKSAVRHDVTPIVCVGESSQIRESGNFHEHIENQVHAAVAGLSAANRERVIFAYEPLWAIGTGSAASAEQVAQVAEIIRESTGSGSLPTTVLYGGSVTVENCSSLAQSGGVDGFLVGGASLRAEDFVTIATLAANCYR
jgi:triosephosphate isomerase